MITYRKAAPDDAAELARLRAVFLTEANDIESEETKRSLVQNNLEYFNTAIKDGSFIAFLGMDGDKIIATSGLVLYSIPPNVSCPNGRQGYLLNMFTFPEYRRQGIASKLLALILNEAKQLGCEKVLLEATDMGKLVYGKIGFDAPGNLMSYHL